MHDAADAVTGGGEYLLRVVENHVDAAPLLQNGESNSEQKNSRNIWREKIAAYLDDWRERERQLRGFL